MSTRNERRAERAHEATEHHAKILYGAETVIVDEDDVSNLLADLMHYCTQNDIDPEALWQQARTNFIAESADENDNQDSED